MHTLLTVAQTVVSGSPAPRETCRAGFCPTLALNTHPKTTSSTIEESIPARLIAATQTQINSPKRENSKELKGSNSTFYCVNAQIYCC